MNKLVYFKVCVLVVALVLVVYFITHMSPSKMAAGMEQVGLAPVAGAPPSSVPQPSVDGPSKVNLCRTRVHAIEWPDGRKLEEASGGMKARWQAYNLTPEDVGSMDIEKWLSLHCEVAASEHQPVVGFKPFVIYKFIDGSQEVLERSPEGVFRYAGKPFVSPALDQAFADLIKVANLEPRGP